MKITDHDVALRLVLAFESMAKSFESMEESLTHLKHLSHLGSSDSLNSIPDAIGHVAAAIERNGGTDGLPRSN